MRDKESLSVSPSPRACQSLISLSLSHALFPVESAAGCVKLLLETTPSVMNWQDYEGRTPLHLAVEIGNNAVVSLLVSLRSCVGTITVAGHDFTDIG